MASERRIGSEDSKTREQLLDAAEELLRTQGHSAVTVRGVAAVAGLKRQLVHYYFRSMEELYLEVLQRAYSRHFERHGRALEAPNPLRALWAAAFYPEGIMLEVYTLALANEYESIRVSISDFLLRSRKNQIESLEAILARGRGKGAELPSPEALAVFLRAVAREIAIERQVGVTLGHDAALAQVEKVLKTFDPEPASA
jgi:TetR/AcrR family transcriptional regulator